MRSPHQVPQHRLGLISCVMRQQQAPASVLPSAFSEKFMPRPPRHRLQRSSDLLHHRPHIDLTHLHLEAHFSRHPLNKPRIPADSAPRNPWFKWHTTTSRKPSWCSKCNNAIESIPPETPTSHRFLREAPANQGIFPSMFNVQPSTFDVPFSKTIHSPVTGCENPSFHASNSIGASPTSSVCLSPIFPPRR